MNGIIKILRINVEKTFKTKKITTEINPNKFNLLTQNKSLIIKGSLGQREYNFLDNGGDGMSLFVFKKQINSLATKIKYLIKSVSQGWFIELNLNGLGFKSFKINDTLALDIGYSSLIIYKPNVHIHVKTFKNKIVLFSIDQEYVKIAADIIRSYSVSDPYRKKGILFKNQILKLKKKR